jgi:hypothetical protein
MKFSYPSLLAENGIAQSQLPTEIQAALTQLHLLEYELSEEEDDAEIAALRKELRDLDKQICQLIEEEYDQEADEDRPADEVRKSVLADLYQTGLRQVKLSHLKKLIPLPAESKWIERVGDYTLTKRKFEDVVHLAKTN